MLIGFFNAIAYTGVFILVLVLLLNLLGKLGPPGHAFRRRFTRAPLLDITFSLISWIPWLVCGFFFGWVGVAGAIIAQVCVIQLWIFGHEMVHPKAVRGPRIVRYLDHRVGWLNNRLALWITVAAFPVFWIVRFAEILLYPVFVRLLGFPRYRHGDWVNLSRHRFRGLVGHDLLWCLYCDWMTGVYSFGAEMLRNVESFWCPIQFDDKIKRENCKQDFPDLDGVWTPAGGTMQDVEALMHRLYDAGNMSWGGHPSRQRESGQKDVAAPRPGAPLGLAQPVPLPLDRPAADALVDEETDRPGERDIAPDETQASEDDNTSDPDDETERDRP